MSNHTRFNLFRPFGLVWFGLARSLTPVADHTHGRRREDEEAFTQQRKLPQHHDLLAEKLDELRHAASRVCYLHKASQVQPLWFSWGLFS